MALAESMTSTVTKGEVGDAGILPRLELPYEALKIFVQELYEGLCKLQEAFYGVIYKLW